MTSKRENDRSRLLPRSHMGGRPSLQPRWPDDGEHNREHNGDEQCRRVFNVVHAQPDAQRQTYESGRSYQARQQDRAAPVLRLAAPANGNAPSQRDFTVFGDESRGFFQHAERQVAGRRDVKSAARDALWRPSRLQSPSQWDRDIFWRRVTHRSTNPVNRLGNQALPHERARRYLHSSPGRMPASYAEKNSLAI